MAGRRTVASGAAAATATLPEPLIDAAATATLVKVVPVSAPPPAAAVAGSGVASEPAGLDGKFAANVTLPDGSVIQVGSLQMTSARLRL